MEERRRHDSFRGATPETTRVSISRSTQYRPSHCRPQPTSTEMSTQTNECIVVASPAIGRRPPAARPQTLDVRPKEYPVRSPRMGSRVPRPPPKPVTTCSAPTSTTTTACSSEAPPPYSVRKTEEWEAAEAIARAVVEDDAVRYGVSIPMADEVDYL